MGREVLDLATRETEAAVKSLGHRVSGGEVNAPSRSQSPETPETADRMITTDELARFEKLRADLFDALALLVSLGGSGKSYDGTFRIQFPGYYEARDDDENQWGIFLDCYLIGPHRHYEWWGATFLEVLTLAETDIRAWMHEALEDE
jgi:hypothetical protein